MAHRTELKAFGDLDQVEEFNRRPLVRASREELAALLKRYSFSEEVILEIGCGAASFEACYVGAKRVVLSDLNLSLLRKNEAPSAKVVCDGEALSFKDHSFQAIVLAGVLHHYADQLKGLSELKRLLSPGGIIFLAEPRVRSLNVFYRELRRLALRWVKPEALAALVGCFSPDETLVDERELLAFFREGYRCSFARKFCLRFPPIKLFSHWELEVWLNHWLDRIPGLERLGAMLYMTVQSER